jgi:uncharacterized membrane protein YkgB
MNTLWNRFDRLDTRLTSWMARYGVLLLRLSLGVVYLWFGGLKFIPGASPAEDLALRTIEILTFGVVSGSTALPILAGWEVLIGLGLIVGIGMRFTLLLLALQMAGTVSPIFFFPQETFTVFPIVPTLEGQYILKNLVIASAALVIGATVRGGKLVAEPEKVSLAGAASGD